MDPWEERTLSEQGSSNGGNEGRNVIAGEGEDFFKVPKYFHWYRSLSILLRIPGDAFYISTISKDRFDKKF
jgi:hypothetical protein